MRAAAAWTIVALSFVALAISGATGGTGWYIIAPSILGIAACILGIILDRHNRQNTAALRRQLQHQRETIASQNRTIATLNRGMR